VEAAADPRTVSRFTSCSPRPWPRAARPLRGIAAQARGDRKVPKPSVGAYPVSQGPRLLPPERFSALDRAVRDRALELDPKFALATYYLGLAQVEAATWMKRRTPRARAPARPHEFLRRLQSRRRVPQKEPCRHARRQFERAAAINPDYAQAYEALGEVDLYLKRTEEAARALERAVELAPDFAKAHYNLGSRLPGAWPRCRRSTRIRSAPNRDSLPVDLFLPPFWHSLPGEWRYNWQNLAHGGGS